MTFTPRGGNRVQVSASVDGIAAAKIEDICQRLGMRRPQLIAQMITYALENFEMPAPVAVTAEPEENSGAAETAETGETVAA